MRDELEVTAGDGSGVSVAGNPVENEAVLQQANNYFAQLEDAAEFAASC